jgi:phenylpyruvate tautomerase PptA (4-oxalocrotonate tautomerase family)
MPLVTVTLQPGKSKEYKHAILGAVHQALVNAGVPQTDRFQRILELDADHFRYDPAYPDLSSPRTADFVLIEVLFSVGRSVKIKKKILSDVMEGLQKDPGLNPENVMLCFKETMWENWSFGGGRLLHT